MIAQGLFEEIVIAGFGGQGVILIGKLLAQSAMVAGHQVIYMPAYGPEVRGGTANCMVVISDEPIASPVVSAPSTVIAMNKASMERFCPKMQSGGKSPVQYAHGPWDRMSTPIPVPTAGVQTALFSGSAC